MDKKHIINISENVRVAMSDILYDDRSFSDLVGNLSREEILNNLVAAEHREGVSRVGAVNPEDLSKVYCFFSPETGDSIIPLKESWLDLVLCLDSSKYGFPDDKTTTTSAPDLEDTFWCLSQPSIERYVQLKAKEELSISELIEDVGYIVNRSTRYAVQTILNAGGQVNGMKDYKPVGDETMRGICTDAGDNIRRFLRMVGIDDRFGFLRVMATNKPKKRFNHDTTLVFDKQEGYWEVISSKDPGYQFNVVPKKELAELGLPHVRID